VRAADALEQAPRGESDDLRLHLVRLRRLLRPA